MSYLSKPWNCCSFWEKSQHMGYHQTCLKPCLQNSLAHIQRAVQKNFCGPSRCLQYFYFLAAFSLCSFTYVLSYIHRYCRYHFKACTTQQELSSLPQHGYNISHVFKQWSQLMSFQHLIIFIGSPVSAGSFIMQQFYCFRMLRIFELNSRRIANKVAFTQKQKPFFVDIWRDIDQIVNAYCR